MAPRDTGEIVICVRGLKNAFGDQIVHERPHHLIDDLRFNRLDQLCEAREVREQHGGEPPVSTVCMRVVLPSDIHAESES